MLRASKGNIDCRSIDSSNIKNSKEIVAGVNVKDVGTRYLENLYG